MNSRSVAMLAIMIFFGSPFSAHAQRIFFHSASIQDHTGVDFIVNGFPFRSSPQTDQPLITTDVTAYLVQGTNTVKWKFTGRPTAEAPALFRFRLEKVTEGVAQVAELFTVERFLEFQQEGDEPAVTTFFAERLVVKPTTDFRHELRTRLTPGKASKSVIDLIAPESRVSPLDAEPSEASVNVALADALLLTLPWQGAPVALTDDDRTELRNLVAAFQAAFVAQDTNALTNLQTVRIQRYATARAQTEAEFTTDLLDSYTQIFGPPAFVFDPLDTSTLTFTSAPDANLVQVEKAGEPPIRATGTVNGTSAVFTVPIYVSKIAGVWKIVD